jgi:hypothetical protein
VLRVLHLGLDRPPDGRVHPARRTVRAVVDPGYGELQGSCWLQAAALPWDAFSLELGGALLNGGRCVINVGASVTRSACGT